MADFKSNLAADRKPIPVNLLLEKRAASVYNPITKILQVRREGHRTLLLLSRRCEQNHVCKLPCRPPSRLRLWASPLVQCRRSSSSNSNSSSSSIAAEQ